MHRGVVHGGGTMNLLKNVLCQPLNPKEPIELPPAITVGVLYVPAHCHDHHDEHGKVWHSMMHSIKSDEDCNCECGINSRGFYIRFVNDGNLPKGALVRIGDVVTDASNHFFAIGVVDDPDGFERDLQSDLLMALDYQSYLLSSGS